MMEGFQSDVELKENKIKTKSGMSLEEFFDVLVGLKSFGTEKDPVSLSKRKARGAAKNVLRAGGVADEKLRKMMLTKQTAFIKSELGELNDEDKQEVLEGIVKMEQTRIFDSFKEAKRELGNDNIQGVILYGSLLSEDKWPNDIDICLVMKVVDRRQVNQFRSMVESLTSKKCDVKEVKTVESVGDLSKEKYIRL